MFALGDVAAADHKMAGAASPAGRDRGRATSGRSSPARASWPSTSRRRPGSSCRSGRTAARASAAAEDELLPAEMVAELKGRDMMVDRYAELLGVPVSARAGRSDGTPG